MANSRLSDMRVVPRLGLNRTELALAIGVSPSTIDLMVTEGALPHPRKWHSRKIWILTEVEAAMFEWPSDGPASPLGEDDLAAWEMSDNPPSVAAPPQKAKRKTAFQRRDEEERILYETLGPEKFTEHLRQRKKEWERGVPAEPLKKGEWAALQEFAKHGVGVPVDPRGIRPLRSPAIDRLKLRGFIDNSTNPKFPDRPLDYWLTEAGLSAWKSALSES